MRAHAHKIFAPKLIMMSKNLMMVQMTESYKMLSLFSWLLSFVALVHGLHLAEEDGDHAHHGAHEVNEQ